MFVMAVPGLASLVERELEEVGGLSVTDRGCDGRADLVLFEASADSRGAALELRTAEDAFIEVGRTRRAEGDDAGRVAARLWRRQRVETALSVWARLVRPLRAAMTYRVVVRVLQERAFLRTELRRQVAGALAADRPRWRPADPAELELWVSEHRPGHLVAGLRVSGEAMRQHGGRAVERPGALRPTVAAAMVRLAGRAHGHLLDPCCGSGTILAEAGAAGWDCRGFDLDPEAVQVARRNAPGAEIEVGDARRLDLPTGSVGACASNLPFGRRYVPQAPRDRWLGEVLAELRRVTSPGGRLVLLAPRLDRRQLPAGLRLAERLPIRLLGLATTIWAFDRP